MPIKNVKKLSQWKFTLFKHIKCHFISLSDKKLNYIFFLKHTFKCTYNTIKHNSFFTRGGMTSQVKTSCFKSVS